MQFRSSCCAKAVHFYSRESGTAIPRLRAGGRLQAWRAGDGEAACPIRAVAAPGPLDPAEGLSRAA
jgi:hypothetical protein